MTSVAGTRGLDEEVGRLRRSSRLAGLSMLVSVVVILGTAVYASRELSRLQRETNKQELRLESLEKQRVEAEEKLVDLRQEVSRVRAASEYLRMGLNNFHARNYTAAVAAYDRAIELDQKNPVLFDLKGYSLLRDGQAQRATESLEKSIELAPNYIWGHYNLALAYWALGRREEAVAEVQRVLEIEPGFKEVIAGDGQFAGFRASEEFRELMSS